MGDSQPNEGLCFNITNIRTQSLPLPWGLKSQKKRRFFILVSDGKTDKRTQSIHLSDGKSLRYNETLSGFAVDPSSHLVLKVFEKHKFRNDKLLATFMIPYETLRLPQHEVVVQATTAAESKRKSSIEIMVTLPEPGLQPEDSSQVRKTADDAVPSSSSSINDKLKASRAIIQEVTQDAEKMTSASAVATNVVSASDNIGLALDRTGQVVTSTKDFLDKCESVRAKLGFIVSAVDKIAEIHPYVKLAWNVLSFIPKQISEQIQLDKEVVDLLDAMERALDLPPDPSSLSSRCQLSKQHEKTLKLIMDQISECGYFIQAYVKDVNFWKRLCKNTISNNRTTIENYKETLKKLRDDFLSESIVTVELNVFRILGDLENIGKSIKELEVDMKLQKLCATGIKFNPEKGCLPHTRVKFLDAITNWVNDPSSPQVLMLFGQAGTGKSAIAHEVARIFRGMGRLTSSYFFARGGSKQESHRFFATLARDLCGKCPAYKASLANIFQSTPDLSSTEDYPTLFEALLRDPLEAVRFVGPVLVVMDALDESEDVSYRNPKNTHFHTFLAKHLHELPSNFRILITSRPEPNILKAFSPQSNFVRHMHMDDDKLSVGVEDDIRFYLRTRLEGAGVDENVLQQLASNAQNLFQWAFVASDYITNPPAGLDSKTCIKRVLNPSGPRGLNPLDILYKTVLEQFDMTDPDVRDNFHSVMGRILIAYQPLSLQSLNTMYQCASTDKADTKDVSVVVKYLGSLLSNVTPTNSTLPIIPLHTSFRDFLTDRNRSHEFYVNVNQDGIQIQVAYASLRTMQELLHFNICNLETSYLLNSEVLNLDNRIEEHIPGALSYSCRFWSEHLLHVSKVNIDLLDCLWTFITEKFLFWLEVLSVRTEMQFATTALFKLKAWLYQRCNNGQNLGRDIYPLVEDALSFVKYFGYPIAQSAPHIYLSALPFAPSSSWIAKLYAPRFPRVVNVSHGRLGQWPALITSISVPNRASVMCVAWSQDNESIAAGLFDGNVFVWNTSTGTKVSGPFQVRLIPNKPHLESAFASSVAFSKDGMYLASGSSKGKVQIWELTTGQPAAERSFSDAGVSSLSFSDDGKQVTLNFKTNGMTLIWDLETSNMQHIRGAIDPAIHSDNPSIYDMSSDDSSGRESVKRQMEALGIKPAAESRPYNSPFAAFPDKDLIATCNSSCIRVLSTKRGELAGGPFASDGTTCLAFSWDGHRIASGSSDGTLRIWDINVVDKDKGRTAKDGEPWSVAFTPDDKDIVVGRTDNTVDVHDVCSGRAVLNLPKGNSQTQGDGWLEVAVSLNGDLIAAAGDDLMCICTRSGETIALLALKSGNEPFMSVAFACDSNNLVAFGTERGTVYIFDASTGTLICWVEQLCGNEVTSLALSVSVTTDGDTSTRLAVGSKGEMFIWDRLDASSSDLRGPFRHHEDSVVNALQFSADTRHVTSAADDYSVCVWDAISGDIVRGPVKLNDDQKVYAQESSSFTAFTRDGGRLAFIGLHNTILVFDVVYDGNSGISLQGPMVLWGHTNLLNRMAFSSDGLFLATTSYSGVRVWDLHVAAELVDSGPDESPKTASLNEAFIDDDGWAVCMSRSSYGESSSRLFWIPDMHRESFHRPIDVHVLVREENKTRVGIEKFVHGKDWVKCKA